MEQGFPTESVLHLHQCRLTLLHPLDYVTAKGFAPLLQFAYTAKLVLSQENIHEVILCADVLGIHNLEDSCFRFLQ
uniref:BTB domain-containing protein n=2 Tax=Oreochromis aureus TaxID=47969 RepID=A0AAZ1XX42_OREAU